MKIKNSFTKEQLEEAILKCLSKSQVLRYLGLKSCGGNFKTLDYLVKTYKLDTSHFTGKGWNTGLNYKIIKPAAPINTFFTKNSNHNTSHLKKRILKENLLKKECSNCKRTKWLKKDIPLELDHIDGDKFNNLFSNLRLLCPNCHSLTPTYRGKKRK